MMKKANKSDVKVLKTQGVEGLYKRFEKELLASDLWKDLEIDLIFHSYKEGYYDKDFKQEMKRIREEIREHVRSLSDFPDNEYLSDLNHLAKRCRDRYNAALIAVGNA